jgi:hypothetical protein
MWNIDPRVLRDISHPWDKDHGQSDVDLFLGKRSVKWVEPSNVEVVKKQRS